MLKYFLKVVSTTTYVYILSMTNFKTKQISNPFFMVRTHAEVKIARDVFYVYYHAWLVRPQI